MRPAWDSVLRALVYEAFALRDDPDAFRRAYWEVVDTHYRWPLVEWAVELAEAKRIEAELLAEYWAWTAQLADRLDELGCQMNRCATAVPRGVLAATHPGVSAANTSEPAGGRSC